MAMTAASSKRLREKLGKSINGIPGSIEGLQQQLRESESKLEALRAITTRDDLTIIEKMELIKQLNQEDK